MESVGHVHLDLHPNARLVFDRHNDDTAVTIVLGGLMQWVGTQVNGLSEGAPQHFFLLFWRWGRYLKASLLSSRRFQFRLGPSFSFFLLMSNSERREREGVAVHHQRCRVQ